MFGESGGFGEDSWEVVFDDDVLVASLDSGFRRNDEFSCDDV